MVIAALMVFPFLFIRSTKGMKFASTITFISHIAFTIAIGINFFMKLSSDGLTMFSSEHHYFWLPHFSELKDGFATAIASFPVVWMAFSF